jgi:hypothetical protein
MSVVAMLGLIVLLGCQDKPRASHENTESLDEFLKRSDELYEVYLVGDRNQAKQSLKNLLERGEAAKLKPYGHANVLFVIYSRMYVFDRRTGNQKLADDDFVQVRYWLLQKLKLSGEPDSQADEEVKEYTADQCLWEVDEWDKAHHNGLPPKYISE